LLSWAKSGNIGRGLLVRGNFAGSERASRQEANGRKPLEMGIWKAQADAYYFADIGATPPTSAGVFQGTQAGGAAWLLGAGNAGAALGTGLKNKSNKGARNLD